MCLAQWDTVVDRHTGRRATCEAGRIYLGVVASSSLAIMCRTSSTEFVVSDISMRDSPPASMCLA